MENTPLEANLPTLAREENSSRQNRLNELGRDALVQPGDAFLTNDGEQAVDGRLVLECRGSSSLHPALNNDVWIRRRCCHELRQCAEDEEVDIFECRCRCSPRRAKPRCSPPDDKVFELLKHSVLQAVAL